MQDVQLIQQIRALKNQELLTATRARVREEKKSTLAVLYHLREIDRRLLHAEEGYSSLHHFATEELGYSSGAAQRRIQAMQLLCDLPELENKIENGKITLDVAARAQSFFKQEKQGARSFSPQEKRELLTELENKSSRECDQKLASMSSHPERYLRPDLIKPVSASLSEVRFVADQSLLEDLNRIREILSHKNPSMKMAELIGEMAKITLKKIDPMLKTEKSPKRAKTAPERKPETPITEISITPAPEKNAQENPAPARPEYIPAEVRRAVFERDGYRCTYRNSITGRCCGSRFRLEPDHIIPVAMGGESVASNLRVRCRTHNRWYANRVYGRRKMDSYRQGRYAR